MSNQIDFASDSIKYRAFDRHAIQNRADVNSPTPSEHISGKINTNNYYSQLMTKVILNHKPILLLATVLLSIIVVSGVTIFQMQIIPSQIYDKLIACSSENFSVNGQKSILSEIDGEHKFYMAGKVNSASDLGNG